MNEVFEFLLNNTNTANVLATISSAIIALIAFLVSLGSLAVSYFTLKHQQRHNRLTVTPIPEATVADFEDSLRVKIRNHGSGPLIVVDLNVGDCTTTTKTILEWMPELNTGQYWTTFSGDIQNRSILPGHEIPLIRLDGDTDDEQFVEKRDECRDALRKLTLNLEFTDIYGTPMKPYRKSLEWFARNLQPDTKNS